MPDSLSAPLPPPPPPMESRPMKNSAMIPNTWTILKSGFEIYKEEARTLMSLGALYFVSSFVLLGLFGATLISTAFVFPHVGIWASAAMVVAVLVIILAFYWFIIWTMLASLYAIRSHSQHIGIKESYRLAFPHVWGYIWISVLSMLVVIGVFALFGIAALIILLPLLALLPGGFGFLAAIAFLIAACAALLVTSTWFGFTTWVFVDEDARGLHAIALSKHLSHINFGQIAWRIFWLGVTYVFALVVVQIVLMVVLSFLPGYIDIGITKVVSNGLALIIALPILLSAFFALYKDLIGMEDIDPMSKEHGEHRGMLIVLAAIGLLTVISIPVASMAGFSYFNTQINQQNDAARISDIDSLHSELQLYYTTHGDVYPNSLDQLLAPGVSTMAGISRDAIRDPGTHQLYLYETSKNKQSYAACAILSSGREYCTTVNTPSVAPSAPKMASTTEMVATSTPKTAKK